MTCHYLVAGVAIATYVAGAASAANKPEIKPTYHVVYYFQPQEQGQPSGITEGAPGLFYTTPEFSVISMTSQGKETILTTLHDPPYILESLPVTAASGLVYSSFETDSGGGGGTYCSSNVFSVSTTAGSQQTYNTSDYNPIFFQNLPDGTLLGWASTCSTDTFHLATSDLSGNITSLYQFPGNGQFADRPDWVLYGSDGNYYGNAEVSDGSGYVYQVTASGGFTKLYTFQPPGVGVLMEASDGNLYGSTPPSSTSNSPTKIPGTIFRLTPSGQYTLLYTFALGQTGNVNNMIEGSDGNLYGVAGGAFGQESHIFRISKSGTYTALYKMSNAISDGMCTCSITQGSDGLIYGVASGGAPSGGGLVFGLDAGLRKPTPKPLQFQPVSGPPGTQVRIWGNNLFSATVKFHGIAATNVSNGGPNYVFATVPAGATSGPITVTTPGGIGKTHIPFTVTSQQGK